ncbi:hypothetical protein DF220_04260 [Salinibacterium hongtaonis]|uniref:Nuclear transport factor 2 family protein n=1 Tax=Homoserinimonas hongtaonis TaxID=2079791 RepID=A0A2U1SZU6_9MICO|nr:hypothetical protein DF220_04260 [Salinibacterium hongtaonis]
MRALTTLTLLILTASLAACAETQPAEPSPVASPSASAALFASEEEATQAADALIKEYWAAINTIFKAGGQETGILEPLVTERLLILEREDAAIFKRSEFRQFGDYAVVGTAFQQMFQGADSVQLIVTTCVDYSQVKAVNSQGQEAVRTHSAPQFQHQVTIHVTEHSGQRSMRLDDSEPMPESPC